ncbi:glycoside hydrolase family protein [Thorsellia kenyensis]|uniref:Lysozyme n=1 Tax=Thorsellia kenyensis TaxID=1549888 RepID=A0ABV6C9I5_9GAMM
MLTTLKAVRALDVKLFQHEFYPLASLLFNTELYFLSNNKAPKLLKNLKNSNYEAAAYEFLDIINGNTSGLVNRRKEKNNMFLHGIS